MKQVGDEQTNSFNPYVSIIVWTVYLIANIAWTAFPVFANNGWAKQVATTTWEESKGEIEKKYVEMLSAQMGGEMPGHKGEIEKKYVEMLRGLKWPMAPVVIEKKYVEMLMGLKWPVDPKGDIEKKYVEMLMGLQWPMDPKGEIEKKYVEGLVGLKWPMDPKGEIEKKYVESMMGLQWPMDPKGDIEEKCWCAAVPKKKGG